MTMAIRYIGCSMSNPNPPWYDGFDAGIWQHMLGGLLLGLIIFAGYYFGMQDVWPITILFSLAFPFRELKQHDWRPINLFNKLSRALEAWPAFFIVWACDLTGRLLYGAV